MGAQHLDRNSAPSRVEGQVDDTHAALADLLDQAIPADAFVSWLVGLARTVCTVSRRRRAGHPARVQAPSGSGRAQPCPYGN